MASRPERHGVPPSAHRALEPSSAADRASIHAWKFDQLLSAYTLAQRRLAALGAAH